MSCGPWTTVSQFEPVEWWRCHLVNIQVVIWALYNWSNRRSQHLPHWVQQTGHEHLIHLSFFTFLVHQFWTGLIWTHQTTRLFCCSKVRSLCYLGKLGFFAIRFTDKYFFLKLHNCSLLLGMLLLSPVNIAVSCAGGLFKKFFNDLMSPNIYITSDHFTIFRIFSPITFLPRSSPPRFK